MKLTEIPDDIWSYIFRKNFLGIEDLKTLSEVCTHLYKIAHQIQTFKYFTHNPFDPPSEMILSPFKKVCVKAWNNVASMRYIPTPDMIKPDFHYIFHTWSDCPNVYFHLFSTKWTNFENIIEKLNDRIYCYHCPGELIPNNISIPYFSFSGKISKNFNVGKKVKIISIGFSNIRDLTMFKNLKELIIKFSNDIDLCTLKGSKLDKIDISDCDITSINGIEGIKNVIISGRNRVTDMSPVSRTPFLTLHNSYIHDLDFIKEVVNLDISESVNITDVFHLLDVRTLKRVTAWRCRWMVGFSELREKGVEVIR